MPSTRTSGGAKSTRANRGPRSKGHFSCEFCRLRKLRCDRPLPCTSCVSRGKTCRLEPQPERQSRPVPTSQESQGEGGAVTYDLGTTVAATDNTQTPNFDASDTSTPRSLSDRGPREGNTSLLSEVQALKRLAQNLEERVDGANRLENVDAAAQQSQPATEVLNSASGASGYNTGAQVRDNLDVSLRSQQVRDVVAKLELVSRGHQWQLPHDQSSLTENFVFRVKPIRDIPHASRFMYADQSCQPIRCIWLPLREEAQVVVNYYVNNVGYIHHVIHHPSLPAVIDDVYGQLNIQGAVRPGQVMLLLSILASVTHEWASPGEYGENPDLIFASSVEANTQASLWIKAALDVLHGSQHLPHGASLETIQGIVVMIYVTANVEGVSLRCRSLLSTGLVLGRELGLHRCDHPSNNDVTDPLRAEMGRRAWWQLVGTDWLMAARYGGPGEGVYQCNPRHMTVNKPRNLNDKDLCNNGSAQHEAPENRPTEMSYSLERLRLAEISRNTADRRHVLPAGASATGPNFVDAISMDAELGRFIQELPPFFASCTEALNSSSPSDPGGTPTGLVVQAYMLNSLVYTQRCKLHLPYLTSNSRTQNSNPVYAYSRETCLSSAQKLVHNEMQLEATDHPFVPTRFRFSGLLHGFFMASIVLIFDEVLCQEARQEASEARQEPSRHPTLGDEVVEALRMLEAAQSQSAAAARLLQLLSGVQGNHFPRLQTAARLQRQQNSPASQIRSAPSSSSCLPSLPHAPPSNNNPLDRVTGDSTGIHGAAACAQVEQPPSFPSTTGAMENGLADVGLNSWGTLPFGPLPSNPSCFQQVAQSLDGLTDLGDIQWDDIFTGLDASSFL